MNAIIIGVMFAVSLIIFWILWTDKTKKEAVIFSFIMMLFASMGTVVELSDDPQQYYSQEYRRVSERWGYTEARMISIDMNDTPLERTIKSGVALLGFGFLFVVAVIADLEPTKEQKIKSELKRKSIIVIVGSLLILCSLYLGLKLTLLPYIKKEERMKKMRVACR